MYEIKRDSAIDNIVRVELSGIYSIDEASQLNTELIDFITSLGHPVNLIMDITHIEKFPSDISKLSKVSAPIAQSDQIKNVVIVMKNNPILKFITNVVTQLFQQPYKIMSSLEDAENYLKTVGVK